MRFIVFKRFLGGSTAKTRLEYSGIIMASWQPCKTHCFPLMRPVTKKKNSISEGGYIWEDKVDQPWDYPNKMTFGLQLYSKTFSLETIIWKKNRFHRQRGFTSWWFQPIWKILVKIGNLPQTGVKIKHICCHQLVNALFCLFFVTGQGLLGFLSNETYRRFNRLNGSVGVGVFGMPGHHS